MSQRPSRKERAEIQRSESQAMQQQAIPTQKRKAVWGFIEHPLTLTVIAILAGVVGVTLFTPVLILCGVLLFAAVVRTSVITAQGRKGIAAYTITALGITVLVYAGNSLLQNKLHPPSPPHLGIDSYRVVLFDPGGHPPAANIYVSNGGGDGKMVVYGDGAVTELNSSESDVIRGIRAAVQKTVKEGGGLVFTIKAGEKRWFTVDGPPLTGEQSQSLGKGERKFFFAGQIVVNGGGANDYPFCSFVVGNRPDVVLQCPEN